MSIRFLLTVLFAGAILLPIPAIAQEGASSDADAVVVESAPVALTVDPVQAWGQEWKLEVSRGGSAPLVWADSLLLVASLDRNLHLVSTAPEPRVRFKESFKGGFSAAPVVTARHFYLAELETGGRLVALDRVSGEIAWTVDAGDLAASPVLEGDRLYTASTLGELGAWSDAGVELWTLELETRVTSRPALLGNVLVVASTDGRLHAVAAETGSLIDTSDPDAGPIWGDPVLLPEDGDGVATVAFATLGGQLLELGADLTVVRQRSFPSRFYAGPTLAGDRLYLVGHEGTIWCYDWKADAIDWKLDLEDATVRMAPALSDEYLAVGDLQGTLAIVDRSSGAGLWTTRLDGALTSTPLFRGDELFVLSEQGTLYAFRPATP